MLGGWVLVDRAGTQFAVTGDLRYGEPVFAPSFFDTAGEAIAVAKAWATQHDLSAVYVRGV